MFHRIRRAGPSAVLAALVIGLACALNSSLPRALAAPPAGADAAPAVPQPVAVVPLGSSSDGEPIVYASLNGGQPLPFVLNMGWPDSTITTKAARTRGLRMRDARSYILGVPIRGLIMFEGPDGREERLKTIEGVRVTLWNSEERAFPLGRGTLHLDEVVRSGDYGTHDEEPVAGSLGQDFLKRYVVQIDRAAKVMRLFDPDRFDASGAGEALPMRYHRGRPVVRATVETTAGKIVEGEWVLDSDEGDDLWITPLFAHKRQLFPVTSGEGESDSERKGRMALARGPHACADHRGPTLRATEEHVVYRPSGLVVG